VPHVQDVNEIGKPESQPPGLLAFCFHVADDAAAGGQTLIAQRRDPEPALVAGADDSQQDAGIVDTSSSMRCVVVIELP
jgi:hypothetical protein